MKCNLHSESVIMPSRGQFFLEDVVDMVGYAVEETSPYAKRMPKGGGGHSKFKDAWIGAILI